MKNTIICALIFFLVYLFVFYINRQNTNIKTAYVLSNEVDLLIVNIQEKNSDSEETHEYMKAKYYWLLYSGGVEDAEFIDFGPVKSTVIDGIWITKGGIYIEDVYAELRKQRKRPINPIRNIL